MCKIFLGLDRVERMKHSGEPPFNISESQACHARSCKAAQAATPDSHRRSESGDRAFQSPGEQPLEAKKVGSWRLKACFMWVPANDSTIRHRQTHRQTGTNHDCIPTGSAAIVEISQAGRPNEMVESHDLREVKQQARIEGDDPKIARGLVSGVTTSSGS